MVSAWLIIICKGLIIACLHCFNKVVDIPSNPQLVFGERWSMVEFTSSSSTFVISNVFVYFSLRYNL